MRDIAAESMNVFCKSVLYLYGVWFDVIIVYCVHGMGLESLYFAADWSLLLDVYGVLQLELDHWMSSCIRLYLLED